MKAPAYTSPFLASLLAVFLLAVALPVHAEYFNPPFFTFGSGVGLSHRQIALAASPDGTYSAETGHEQIDMSGSANSVVRCIVIMPRVHVSATAAQTLQLAPRTNAEGHLADDTAFTAATKVWTIPITWTGEGGTIFAAGSSIVVFDKGYRYLDVRLAGDEVTNQPLVTIQGVVGGYCPPYVDAYGN